ncbi:hypothetical protein J3F83DRAFT_724478 [Trichoderma novae-zelandiae]
MGFTYMRYFVEEAPQGCKSHRIACLLCGARDTRCSPTGVRFRPHDCRAPVAISTRARSHLELCEKEWARRQAMAGLQLAWNLIRRQSNIRDAFGVATTGGPCDIVPTNWPLEKSINAP